jgi:hypothetical protein
MLEVTLNSSPRAGLLQSHGGSIFWLKQFFI